MEIFEKHIKGIPILQRGLKTSSANGRQEAKGELIHFLIILREKRGRRICPGILKRLNLNEDKVRTTATKRLIRQIKVPFSFS